MHYDRYIKKNFAGGLIRTRKWNFLELRTIGRRKAHVYLRIAILEKDIIAST
jgi:hypothetical protein